MYLIFLILLWVVLAVWTLLFFAMDVAGAALTLWIARRIKVPLFLAVAAIWCCSVALKYLWPIITFGLGAYAHLYGWSLFHQASAHSNKITLDPFVLAIALWTSGVTLCAER